MIESRQRALELLHEKYDFQECPKCEVREEFGLVLGDENCAIGVAVCPHCGHHSRCLTYDPEGVATEHPYKWYHKLAMRWKPPWYNRDDCTTDWRCACGKTWTNSYECDLHIATEHPEKANVSTAHHDRYPWDNLELAEGAIDK